MALAISTPARNASADGAAALINGGAGAGTIEIRTGPPPATPATPDAGILLRTLPFSDPAFGSAAAGTATAAAITSDVSVDASGTAGHFRVKDSNGVVIMQGTVGTSGADLNFNTVAFVAGATATVTSLTLSQPAS